MENDYREVNRKIDSMISLIMPAKNASAYIGDAISALQKSEFKDWELVIVEDHSDDNTFEIANEYSKGDSRIKVFRNPGKGKVQGLNFGYSKATGDYIKCIDADDVLDEKYFTFLDEMRKHDAACHSVLITNERLEKKAIYHVDKTIMSMTFEQCLKSLKSLPRCSWSFDRRLADHIFPMPESLPFEDVWFSLIIKKYAKSIFCTSEPLYLYRQYNGQTFGGIMNCSQEILAFRARRLLKLMEVIKEPSCSLAKNTQDEAIFREAINFNNLMCKEKIKVSEILFSGLPLTSKSKLMIFRKFNKLAPFIVKIKWLMDKR